jgi:hypothetical protein
MSQKCMCVHTDTFVFKLQYHCTVNLFLWVCCNRIPKCCGINVCRFVSKELCEKEYSCVPYSGIEHYFHAADAISSYSSSKMYYAAVIILVILCLAWWGSGDMAR